MTPRCVTRPPRIPLWRNVRWKPAFFFLPTCVSHRKTFQRVSLPFIFSLSSPSGGLVEDTSDHRRSHLLQLPGGPWDGVPGFQEGKLGRQLVELRPNMWKTSLKKITTNFTDPTRRQTAGQIPQRWGGFPVPPDLWVGLVRSRLKVETTQRPRGHDV